jgi:hypothetical protein
MPEKRPIPATLPGGACASPFGEGAPAAVQDDFELTVPEGRVVPPEDNRVEPVRRPSRVAAEDPAGGETAPDRDAPDGADRRETAAGEPDTGDADEPPSGLATTGLAVGALVLGALGVLVAGGMALRGTVRSHKEDRT